MRLIGHSDQGGRRDGIQVMVENGLAYIGICSPMGAFPLSTCAIRRTPSPPAMSRRPPTPGTHLQVADNLLLVIHGKDVLPTAPSPTRRATTRPPAGTALGTAKLRESPRLGRRPCRLRHLDARPAQAHRLQLPVSGGIHRIGGPAANGPTVSALLDGSGLHLHDGRHVGPGPIRARPAATGRPA